MRGNELLEKLELIDPAYVEAADEKPVRRNISWIKWGAAAACLGAVLLAGAFLLRGRGPAVLTADVGGIAREYKNVLTYHTMDSLAWPWAYQTTEERYGAMEWNGKSFFSRRSTVDRSLLGEGLGTAEVTGGDLYSDEVHALTCQVYSLSGVSPSLFVAVELDGEFYVFYRDGYDPPATLGEVLDGCSLSRTLTLEQFTRHNGPEESGTYRQDSDSYLWSVLEGCRDAAFVEDDDRNLGEYLSFTAESEALGVHNRAFYVTKDGYIWTNIFDYAYMFHIGEEAAGRITDYALSHSEPVRREPRYETLAGTLTAITEDFLFIDDTVLCAAPGDGMVFKVPLDDLRISRRIDFQGISTGELVEVSFTGKIDTEAGNLVEGAFELTRCHIIEGEVFVPQ